MMPTVSNPSPFQSPAIRTPALEPVVEEPRTVADDRDRVVTVTVPVRDDRHITGPAVLVAADLAVGGAQQDRAVAPPTEAIAAAAVPVAREGVGGAAAATDRELTEGQVPALLGGQQARVRVE